VTGSGRDAGTAELVVVLPALMILLALVLQFVFFVLASHTVEAAAATGGDVARAYGSTPAAGVAAADRELQAIGGRFVLSPKVNATELSGGEEVVTVEAGVISLLPGINLDVHASSIGPLSQFRAGG
jgi:hypothetical protein